jgi:phosphoserine phosphatase RsbU/P
MENLVDESIYLLLIEDDRIAQMAFERLVKNESLPYKYMIASGVQEAIAILKENHFYIILSDYILGDGTAFEILDAVKNIPIVLITGAGDEELAIKIMKAGAYDYLIKDVENRYLKFLPVTVANALKRNNAEEQLRKLSQAVHQSPSSIVITDLDGNIEYVNPRFTATTGYTIEEVRGKNPRILRSDGTPPEIYKDMWDTLAQGDEWRGEFCNIKKDGKAYWEVASISGIKNSTGKVTHYLKVAEDITRRKEAEEALRLRNEQMENDLELAQVIHHALLPQAVPQLDYIKIAYRYSSLDAIGGDYFSFLTTREGDLGFFIGDVQGHGVSAALFTALVKSTTDALFRIYGMTPQQYVHQLNQELFGNMPNSLLTAIYGLFQPTEGESTVRFTFSKGGHPLPIVHRKSGELELVRIKGTLIGIFDDAEYTERCLLLEPGDRLYLYTDGITETMNPDEQMLGYEGLLEIIEQVSSPDLDATVNQILKRVDTYRQQVPVQDDIVLIGIEVKESKL